MSLLHRTLAALAAAAVASAALAAPAPAAAPDVRIEPHKMERGADVAIPHLHGNTVVDGDVRVKVEGQGPLLMGRSGKNGYIVAVRAEHEYQAVRVAPGREQRTVVGGDAAQVTVSGDGETLAVIDRVARRSRIDVRSSRTGRLLASGVFRGFPMALDIDGDHVVVGSYDRGAIDFNWREGTRRTISTERVYAADLSSNRLAYFDGDPYDGGCSMVTTLARPDKALWRSCQERVWAFSPNGGRIVTIHKMADGPGPNQITERTVRGRLFARYTVGGFFESVRWESAHTLLTEAYGRHRGATVRCSEGDCERASAVRPTPEL